MPNVIKDLDCHKTYLITGVAGFIGFSICKYLLDRNCQVVGTDNLNNYYDVNLKKARLDILKKYNSFKFNFANLEDKDALGKIFDQNKIEIAIHLGAQAGVRYSMSNPEVYIQSNIVGFFNILELCRYNRIEHLIFASSSSVYGMNIEMPFSVHHNVDHPISLYAATKKTNELMAHTYSHSYGLPTTGLRLFTVYGPWGRPDMAYFLFSKAILSNDPINVFNHGKMKRDFTYIDDIVEVVARLLNNPPVENQAWDKLKADPSTSSAPFRIYNIGNNQPIELMSFIEALEEALGKKAIINFMPLQDGDIPATYADVNDLMSDVGFKPNTPLKVGIKQFAEWYRKYHGI